VNVLGELVQTETTDGVRLDGFLSVPAFSVSKKRENSVWIITHGVNGNFYASNLLKSVAEQLSKLGFAVLLANTRGHDICSFNNGTIPMRIGSEFENLGHCGFDFQAWNRWIQDRGSTLFGVAAHSLGAVKAAFWVAESGMELDRFIAISPPRLNTQLLLGDPKRAAVFAEHLQLAQSLCDQGKPDEVIKVRFPLPNWVSASTFLDKYGSGNKYDYLTKLERIRAKVLWVFGGSEVRNGSINFLDADIHLRSEIERSSLFRQSVEVIDGADHSYRDKREDLAACIEQWDRENV
jgi:alpha/beta superfamily hydrolase